MVKICEVTLVERRSEEGGRSYSCLDCWLWPIEGNLLHRKAGQVASHLLLSSWIRVSYKWKEGICSLRSPWTMTFWCNVAFFWRNELGLNYWLLAQEGRKNKFQASALSEQNWCSCSVWCHTPDIGRRRSCEKHSTSLHPPEGRSLAWKLYRCWGNGWRERNRH